MAKTRCIGISISLCAALSCVVAMVESDLGDLYLEQVAQTKELLQDTHSACCARSDSEEDEELSQSTGSSSQPRLRTLRLSLFV